MPHTRFVIVGRTRAGKQFRPSDWAERLCSQSATFCDKARLTYSPHMKPVVVEGFRSVLVSGEFEQADPRGWQFVLGFARDNELEIRADAPCEEAPPVAVEPGATSGPVREFAGTAVARAARPPAARTQTAATTG